MRRSSPQRVRGAGGPPGPALEVVGSRVRARSGTFVGLAGRRPGCPTCAHAVRLIGVVHACTTVPVELHWPPHPGALRDVPRLGAAASVLARSALHASRRGRRRRVRGGRGSPRDGGGPACLRRERGVGGGDELRGDGLAAAPGFGRIPPLGGIFRRIGLGAIGAAIPVGLVLIKEGSTCCRDRACPKRSGSAPPGWLGRLRRSRRWVRLARVPDARAAAGRRPDPHRPGGLCRGRFRRGRRPRGRPRGLSRGSIRSLTCCCGS